MIKRVLEIVVVLMFFVPLFLSGVQLKKEREKSVYMSLTVNVKDSNSVGFVSNSDVLKRLSKLNLVEGKTLCKDVDLTKIEELLASDPYINSVEAYIDMRGNLSVDIDQFSPKIRVIQHDGVSYFVDKNRKAVKIKGFTTKDLPIISVESEIINLSKLPKYSEELSDKSKTDIARVDNLMDFCKYIEDDSFWKNLIVQININKHNDVELIPRIGNHLVVVCSVDSISCYKKYLDKLQRFYTSKTATENNVYTKYKKIDLKYNDQVVCTKRKL